MVGDSIIDEPVPCQNYSFPEQYWHTYNNEIYASVSIATTQAALDSSVDEAKTVCKAIFGSGSLLFKFSLELPQHYWVLQLLNDSVGFL